MKDISRKEWVQGGLAAVFAFVAFVGGKSTFDCAQDIPQCQANVVDALPFDIAEQTLDYFLDGFQHAP